MRAPAFRCSPSLHRTSQARTRSTRAAACPKAPRRRSSPRTCARRCGQRIWELASTATTGTGRASSPVRQRPGHRTSGVVSGRHGLALLLRKRGRYERAPPAGAAARPGGQRVRGRAASVLDLGAADRVVSQLGHGGEPVDLALTPGGGPVQPPNGGCGGCAGILTVDPRTGRVQPTLDFYELAQLSHFVRLGRSGSNRPRWCPRCIYTWPHWGWTMWCSRIPTARRC